MNTLTSRSFKRTSAIAALCAMASLAAAAQGVDVAMQDRLRQVARSHTADHQFMGTVLVAKGDDILINEGYGMADMSWNIPNAPDVKFRIASLTKQFTAALILQLQDAGKLRIDQLVSKYLPNIPEAWQDVTVANLLGHTSGIPSFTTYKQFREWSMSPRTPEEIFAFFHDAPLNFAPGTKYEYSNSGYAMLGMVVEHVSGRPYRDMLHERILQPLQMTDAGFDSDTRIVEKAARGYRHEGGELVRARPASMTVPWAAGAMYATTADLLKWERGLFGGKVMSASSLKAMTTPGEGHHGLGVYVEKKYDRQVVWHNGRIEGFDSTLAYLPAEEITVVVLGNVNGFVPTILGDQLLKVALGKPVVLANERRATPISSRELAKFASTYSLPGETLTFTVDGDVLIGKAVSVFGAVERSQLLYQGVKGKHPYFYFEARDTEIEFVPDAHGELTSIVMHGQGQEIHGTRQLR